MDDKSLPASQTEEELPGGAYDMVGLYGDPRAGNSDYEYTAAPTDNPRMPGEYEPIRSLLVAPSWGHRDYYAALLRAAVETVTPTVVVENALAAEAIESFLWGAGIDTSRLEFHILPTDTVWIRDYGPLTVRTRNGFRFIDTRYFDNRPEDDLVPTALGYAWDIPVSRPRLRIEGGNFQADGRGRCITTEWVVQENQNFGYREADVTQILKDYLGCTRVTYVPYLAGERTRHVDMLAMITGPASVLVGSYEVTQDDENSRRLDEAARRLEADGFTVRRIPMPTPVNGTFRTYTNSVVLNDQVLVPVYWEDTTYEREALDAYRAAYPRKTITPIDASSVITEAGAVHCTTMTIVR